MRKTGTQRRHDRSAATPAPMRLFRPWQRLTADRDHDPPAWMTALFGVALGFGLFVLVLALLGAVYLAAHLTLR